MWKAFEPETVYDAATERAALRPALQSQARADVCIVGGGFTGLSAALDLASAGARVTLLEANSIGFGASGRNGGQIHTGFRKTQEQLEHWLGKIHARDLWVLSEEAKTLVRELVAKYEIGCGQKDGLAIAAHDRAAARALDKDTEYLQVCYNYAAARTLDAAETAQQLGTQAYRSARFDSGGGYLQPLALSLGLASAAEKAGAHLYESTMVKYLDRSSGRVRVVCENGTVEADRVIVACDAFAGSVLPELAPFIAHVESFVTATEPLSAEFYKQVLPCDAAVADTRHVLDYYRKDSDRRLLFAGRESYFSVPRDIAALVRPRMLRIFPMLKPVRTEFAWRGTVGITRTRMPHFGQLTERIFFGHGYSGQGVALANLGGKAIAQAIRGNRERFDTLARVPARRYPGGATLRRPLVSAGLLWFKLLDHL